MAKNTRKRVKIKGHYMQVRQRSTVKGKKGTILGKWTSAERGKRRAYKCAVGTSSKIRESCGLKKAGKRCLREGKGNKKCAQLLVSYC